MSSVRRQDILSLCNLRQDGRKQHEIRRINCNLRPLNDNSVASSSIFQLGLTKILCTVEGPMECSRRSDENPHRANIHVTVKSAPFSSFSRSTNNSSVSNKRYLEMSQEISQAFEAAVILDLYPRCVIHINCHILQDDGGVLECAINAVTLALVNAGVALKDLVCSCSVGLMISSSSHVCIIDLNKGEENESYNGNVSKMSAALMPQRGSVVLSKLASSRLKNVKELEGMMKAASEGCKAVYDIMTQCIRDHHATMIAARMGNAQVSYNDVAKSLMVSFLLE